MYYYSSLWGLSCYFIVILVLEVASCIATAKCGGSLATL